MDSLNAITANEVFGNPLALTKEGWLPSPSSSTDLVGTPEPTETICLRVRESSVAVFVDDQLVYETSCTANMLRIARTQPQSDGELARLDARASSDAVIQQLVRSLRAAVASGHPFGKPYADGLGLAIVARWLDLDGAAKPAPRRTVRGLPNWRLKRAVAYIDAHIADPITLAELAGSTGLTRMHFASQFRKATGLRPHEFILRKRIDRAREMLSTSTSPLTDVALGVGFQSQAHFSTVFKRFVGETPGRWRERNRL